MILTSLDREIPDNLLVKELKEGSSKAFDLIFRKYYDNLCRFAFSILHDADLSQSLMQNVFVKFWERRFISGEIRNLPAYLVIMAKNQIFDYIKDREGQEAFVRNYKHGIVDESTENEILRKDFEEKLVVALGKLPGRCRLAFELSRFESMSNKDIAEKMNISVKGVEVLIGRSLKILRTELTEFLPSFRLKDDLVFLFLRTNTRNEGESA